MSSKAIDLYKKLSTASTIYWHLGPVDLYNELKLCVHVGADARWQDAHKATETSDYRLLKAYNGTIST